METREEKLKNYKEQADSKSCKYCGFKGICNKYEAFEKVRIYLTDYSCSSAERDANIDGLKARMGQECNKFEYYLT